MTESAGPHTHVTSELWNDARGELDRYVEILATRGIEWGLVGPAEAGRLWERHVLNSLAIVPFVPPDSAVLDVGSGAGLPGVPLALVRRDVRVTLLEPLLRRSRFLEQCVAELGLQGRVNLRRGRAEDERGAYDVVTARAVAPLQKLVGWCAPLIAPGGRLVALKGRSAGDETRAAADELKARRLTATVHEVSVDGSDGPTWVVEVFGGR